MWNLVYLLRIVGITIALLLVLSCGGQAETSVTAGGLTVSELNLTQIDNGKSFDVHQGDLIFIRLAENPTTGYRWVIDKNDDTLLAPQSTEYAPSSSGAVGGGGQRTFAFKTNRAGTVHLQLKHWREWEGDRSITARYAVTIQIK